MYERNPIFFLEDSKDSTKTREYSSGEVPRDSEKIRGGIPGRTSKKIQTNYY